MRRRDRRWAVVLAGALAAVALAGCVNLPTAGPVPKIDRLSNPNGPADEGVQVSPIGPGAQWPPQEIVSDFLAASGAAWTGEDNSLGVAREYLTRSFAKRWHPSVAATVIDNNPAVPAPPIPRVTGGQVAQVELTSQHLETLVSANSTEAGSIETATYPGPYQFIFNLVQVAGQWRISEIRDANGTPRPKILLLTNSDFLRDYQPRNLYFPANAAPGTLVPYPVYIPDQAGLLGLRQLVSGLTALPQPKFDWLYGAVTTAFPVGSNSRNTQVEVHGNQAVVTLTGAASKLSPPRLEQLKAQLFWTLTYSPYAPTGIGSVELDIAGHKAQVLPPKKYLTAVPLHAKGPLYVQLPGQDGTPELATVNSIKPSARGKSQFTPQTLPGGIGTGPFTAMAISPTSQIDGYKRVTFAACRGKTIYVAPLTGYVNLIPPRQLVTNCTSMSWNPRGGLWVTDGSNVDVVHETDQGLTILPVTIYLPTSDTFSSLRVAPDGIRAAMIVHAKSGSTIEVAAISKKSKALVLLAQSRQWLTVGPDLTDPIALCWLDPDHLLVLDRRDGRSQLFDVPLNGAKSTEVATPPGAISVASNGSIIAVGTLSPSGQSDVKVARTIGSQWHRLAGAGSPVYPG
jgi:lipoprotein LpqB-like beta-propeller protein